ncbi:uncharacterized protein [Diadema setosum]|uniref:uncharacterized protein n=1 Tax=Diadema setosum TaxID=31175 RepID=UPI003B3A9000
MGESRDQASCCALLPDWLDYALSVLSLRIGGYRELEEEIPANRTLNIRCHDSDRAWVDQQLRPLVSEHLPSFSEVSFGDKLLRRDDAFVFDRFKDDLEVSFKTVFVVSRSALADANFIAMVRASLRHLNTSRLQKVLLIFLDHVSELDMPFCIAYYVDQRLPYLEWPQGAGKRAYFWKKLAKMTAINKRMTIVLPERCLSESPFYR